MKHLCVMFLLLCCTKVTKTAIPQVVAPLNPVIGIVGDNLILPCYLKPSVSAVDMEVQWIDKENKLVHHYRRHMDVTDEQLPAYSGRTSLFREELQRGNISLKLRSVNISDTNTYRCYIKTDEGTDDASFEVKIHEPGNEPEISAVSHYNGSVALVCVSKNWLQLFKPAMEWMDGQGEILQHAGVLVYTSYNTTVYVQRSVTVQEKHGYNYTCIVSYKQYRKEKLLEVKGILFALSRHHWIPLAILISPFILLILLVCMWVYRTHKGTLIHFKRQVLQDYNATLLNKQKHWPDVYITPQIIQTFENHDQQIYKNIPLEHIFAASDFPGETNAFPKVVILQGRSGYGKSFTAQKIVQGWASGTYYVNQFDLVLLLKSEDLNQQMKNPSVEMKLVELVCPHEIFRPMVEKTLMKLPHKVLFIIDGFDELTLPENGTHPTVSNPFSPASVEGHILALLSGRILLGSSLLVTTRPSALDRLRGLIQRGSIMTMQIMGFSKDDVEQYFEKFFKSTDKDHRDLLYSTVHTNETLSASCCIPGMCCMVCTFLKSKDETPDKTKPETVTAIFLELVISLVKQNYSKDVLDVHFLNDLDVLAKGGKLTKKNQESSKDLSDLKRNPFLCREPPQMQLRFTYRVFQEFFTALHHIILSDDFENVKELLPELKKENLIKNTRWFAVIRFLFGLSNTNVRHLYTPNVVDEEHMTSVLTLLKNWVYEEIKKKPERYVRLFLLRCLYELHDKEVTNEAMQGMDTIDLNFTFLNEVDCLVLQYCLQCCPNITRLKLRECRLKSEELKPLTPALGNLQELWLDVEDLADADVDNLISSLRDRKILREHSPAETSGPQDKIRLSAVKNLSCETAANLIDTFGKSKRDAFVSIEVAEKNTNVLPSVCSSMSVYKDSSEVHVVCKPQQSGGVPAVSLMNLTMTPPEDSIKGPLATSTGSDSIMIWTGIMKCLSSQENVIADLRQYLCKLCDLKEARIIVHKLIQNEAEEMFSQLLEKCPKLTNLRLEICKEGGEQMCLSLDKVKNRFCLKVTGYSTADIELILSEIPEPPQVTDLLNKVRSLGNETDDLDKRMGALLSFVSTLCEVKRMTLMVKCLKKSWANEVIKQMQKSPTLQDVRLMALRKEQIDPQNICSSLSLKKLDNSCLMVTADCGSEISKVSLILPPTDARISECTNIVQQIHSSGKATEINNVELDNIVRNLLSLPWLEHVDLRVSCLTEIWTNRILSTIKDRMKKIKVNILNKYDAEERCFEREGGKLRLTANNWMLYKESYITPALSHISVLSEAHSVDWISFLNKFYTLKELTESHPGVDGHLNGLMELLCSNRIKDVNLKVGRLTESWAERIINLIQKCPSLENVSFSAGFNTFVGDFTDWVEYGYLEKDAIHFLKKSKKDMKCNITISGINPYTIMEKCRGSVKIKI